MARSFKGQPPSPKGGSSRLQSTWQGMSPMLSQTPDSSENIRGTNYPFPPNKTNRFGLSKRGNTDAQYRKSTAATS